MNKQMKWIIAGIIANFILTGVVGIMVVAKNPSPVATVGTIGGQLLEEYNPYVRYNGGTKTGLPMYTTSTFQADGATTLGSTLTVSNDLTVGEGTTEWIQLDLVAGDDDDYWTNDTGATTTILTPQVGFSSGVASSTYDLYLFATTSTSIANAFDYVQLTDNNLAASPYQLMPTFTYATSTGATTTNSIMNVPVNGRAVVPPNWNVIFYMQQGEQMVSPAATDGSFEESTSTARGFNPYALFEILY